MSDKIKKLSEAIRLGATFHPQGYYAFFQYRSEENHRHEIEATCTLGAAAEAVMLGSREVSIDSLQKRFPKVSRETLKECIKKNDTDKISREVIADWLEAQGL
jgi:hypothetical protein